MMKLVRNGNHMRPLLAVLERNGIGSIDKYDRGRWIAESDLPTILTAIKSDPTAIKGGEADDTMWLCDGTNSHNQVWFRDFEELFE